MRRYGNPSASAGMLSVSSFLEGLVSDVTGHVCMSVGKEKKVLSLLSLSLPKKIEEESIE